MRFGFAAAAVLTIAVIGGLLFLLYPGGPTNQSDEPIQFYCAAGIRKPVEEIAKRYRKELGIEVQIKPDGSGTLLGDIKIKPGHAHVYLTADPSYVDQGRGQGLLAEAIPVAKWYPVLAVAPGNPKGVKTIADVFREEVKLVVANPQAASVGRTVQAALEPSGDWAKIKARKDIVFAGTVSNVANSLTTGAADAGFIWNVTAVDNGLKYFEPDVLKQAKQTIFVCVVTKHDRPTDALRFARYLTSRDKGMPVFKQHHYEPIDDADAWAGPQPEVTIYAGTMLKPGIEAAIRAFEKREGVKIVTVYNGCGALVTQMKTQVDQPGGLVPEVYVSCDQTFLDMVEQHFEKGITLSENKIVIVVNKKRAREAGHKIESLQDLTKPGLRVGFADDRKTALGALTRQLLESTPLLDEDGKAKQDNDGKAVSLWDGLKPENRADTKLFASGHDLIAQARTALDVAIAYKSNVLCDEQNMKDLDIVEVSDNEAMASQPFAISKSAKHRYLMLRLQDAITTAKTQKRFQDIGFNWVHKKKKSGKERPSG